MSGQGKAVVLCVGARTLRQKEIKDVLLNFEDEETPIQKKLSAFAELISSYAYFAAFFIFVLLSAFQFGKIIFGSDELVQTKTLMLLIANLQVTIAIIIVCVPEGLPLVISISMAFSIDNLIRDQLLIKKIEALEVSGSVIDIMTGKTGTLTTGVMEVERIYTGQRMQPKDQIEINIE